MTLRKLLVAIALSCTPGFALAVGLTCMSPSTALDKRICGDPTLAAQDAELNGLYALARVLVADRTTLLREQRAWLSRQQRCPDMNCLRAIYTSRLGEIRTLINSVTKPLPTTIRARRVERNETSETCRFTKTPSFFEIVLNVAGSTAQGRIDGLYDCGDKVWGPVDIEGTVNGRIATVTFDGGFDYQTSMKAFIVFDGRSLHWQVYDYPTDESFYMPPTDRIPVGGS